MAKRSRVGVDVWIRSRLRMSEVAREFGCRLVPIGDHFKGRCPFHRDRQAVLVVSDALGRYHCFGCGESGDQIAFAMKVMGVGCAFALRFLDAKIRVEQNP